VRLDLCVCANREPGESGDDCLVALERHGAPSEKPNGSGLAVSLNLSAPHSAVVNGFY